MKGVHWIIFTDPTIRWEELSPLTVPPKIFYRIYLSCLRLKTNWLNWLSVVSFPHDVDDDTIHTWDILFLNKSHNIVTKHIHPSINFLICKQILIHNCFDFRKNCYIKLLPDVVCVCLCLALSLYEVFSHIPYIHIALLLLSRSMV